MWAHEWTEQVNHPEALLIYFTIYIKIYEEGKYIIIHFIPIYGAYFTSQFKAAAAEN